MQASPQTPTTLMALSALVSLLCLTQLVQGFSPVGHVELHQPETQSNSDTKQLYHSAHHITRRHAKKDFAPKITHQPASVTVKPQEPLSLECAIEAQPVAEVKWFKDDELLASRPTHHEQTGTELMFFQVADEDAGEYHCEATNYLGSVTSDRFKLHVHSSIQDPRIRFEPKQAEVGPDQLALFKCSIPIAEAEVSWRRNGKRLSVRWLDESDDILGGFNGADLGSLSASHILASAAGSQPRTSRYLARQLSSTDYVLLVVPNQLSEDNTTFTCLYRDYDTNGNKDLASAAKQTGNKDEPSESLPHESGAVKLRVLSGLETKSAERSRHNTQQHDNIKLDINLATPIQNLSESKSPHQISAATESNINNNINNNNNNDNNNNSNQTTQLEEPKVNQQRNGSADIKLARILGDLYEIAKPTLVVFCILLIVAFSLGQLMLFVWRRRGHYKKHQHNHYSAGSGSSATSSVIGSNFDCDPVLKSLMGRTLSAPMASSTSLVAGAGKKYRSYRDHMRKVAAASDQLAMASDLVDGLLHYQHHSSAAGDQFGAPLATSTAGASNMPNLYNQSLAAREQARNLLKASEHMRSLSNLTSYANQNHNVGAPLNQQQQQQQQQRDQFGRLINQSARNQTSGGHLDSHLNLANFGLEQAHNSHQFLWPPHLGARSSLRQPQQRNHLEDQSHLVTSSTSGSSHSPSSASSLNSSRDRQQQQQHQQQQHQQHHRQMPKESISNHYSTIENNEDEECRYEEVDAHSRSQQRQQQQLQPQPQQLLDGSLEARMRSRQQPAPNNLVSLIDSSNGENELTSDKFARSFESQQTNQTNQSFQDQLSPYAVSSICGSLLSTRPPLPPMNNEAMRALNEQFGVNRLVELMLLDEPSSSSSSLSKQMLPFDAPPPPSSPPPIDEPEPKDAPDRVQVPKKRPS